MTGDPDNNATSKGGTGGTDIRTEGEQSSDGSASAELPCSGQGTSTDPATGEATIERLITFDEEGRIVQVASNPNAQGELQELTTSEYDDQGRLLEKTITEPSVGFVQVNTHEYDQDGKLTAVTSERNGQVVAIERFFYDDNGLRAGTEQYDGDGTTLRATSVWVWHEETSTWTARYDYVDGEIILFERTLDERGNVTREAQYYDEEKTSGSIEVKEYDTDGLLRREEVTLLPEEETFVLTFSYQFPPECSK